MDSRWHVQAHGGGIIEVNGVYYWAGENHLNGGSFQSINCYSSTVHFSSLRKMLYFHYSSEEIKRLCLTYA
jgi:hypothetical protein